MSSISSIVFIKTCLWPKGMFLPGKEISIFCAFNKLLIFSESIFCFWFSIICDNSCLASLINLPKTGFCSFGRFFNSCIKLLNSLFLPKYEALTSCNSIMVLHAKISFLA